MRRYHLVILAFAAALIAGCGDHRVQGDADGTPVAFHVRLDDAFVSEYHREAPVFIVHGGVWAHPGPYGFHHHDPFCDPWWGPGFAEPADTTTFALLAGDAAGHAQLFRHRLGYGDNDFTIPVRVGRTATLTFVADGGVQGWETVGTFTVSGVGQRVEIILGRDGPKVAVSAPTQPPADAAAPATTPSPAGSDRPAPPGPG